MIRGAAAFAETLVWLDSNNAVRAVLPEARGEKMTMAASPETGQ